MQHDYCGYCLLIEKYPNIVGKHAKGCKTLNRPIIDMGEPPFFYGKEDFILLMKKTITDPKTVD
jgi:hypothetical protein